MARRKNERDPKMLSLDGELFWEYRAKLAEWEKSYLENKVTSDKVISEKLKPQYNDLIILMLQEEETKQLLKAKGLMLMSIQTRIAEKLGVSLEDFTNKYVIDLETGAVRIIE